MKIKYLLVLLLVNSISCKSQENRNSETIKSDYIQEMTPINTVIKKYLNTNYVALNSLNVTEFTKKTDSLKRMYTTLLNRYKGKLDEGIFKDEFLTVNSIFHQKTLEYPEQHKKFTGEIVVLSKKNQAKINRFLQKSNDANLLSNKSFRRFIESYIRIESRKEIETLDHEKFATQQLTGDLITIDALFKNKKVIDFWTQEYLYNHIYTMGIRNITHLYERFIASCETPEYTTKVRDIYNSHKKGRASHNIEIYKKVKTFELEMHLFLPDTIVFKGDRPTIVQFHGGSWSGGKPDWFFETAAAYAKQGWVIAVVEYRIKAKQGNSPFQAVKDAKSAIRWLRKNAERLKIDSNKIVATGNSAGGHLAIATSLVENWNEKTDDRTISAVPTIVIVNSAVYDLTVANTKWIVEGLENKDLVKEISPNSLISKSTTKMLLIHGENDRRCTYSSAEKFYTEMKSLGNDIELHTIKDATHFIWYGRHSQEVSKITSEYLEKLNF
ncbi:prolyl oligopeptidase family serine peptidase [Kordia sp. YSTF-M3]|uniref:Prolyl oligopeptidase family serine peptidase n=1 Tax=Kordia aestuariivivens TaxID=2759037 RepID=A0ABR7QB20_9FLAO|nr:prolyl oligopeptidase family serine peptidase [Kordia aestuariivivens]MBC8755771.1 prolyl oligopeptidase family serine peptidase [Kordia aestuariivivens]